MTLTLGNLIPIDIDRRLLYIGWLDFRLFTTSAEFCDSLVATGGHGFALTLLQNWNYRMWQKISQCRSIRTFSGTDAVCDTLKREHDEFCTLTVRVVSYPVSLTRFRVCVEARKRCYCLSSFDHIGLHNIHDISQLPPGTWGVGNLFVQWHATSLTQ